MKQQGLQAGLIRLGGKEGRGRPLALASLRPELEEGEGWGAETGECVVSFFLWMSVLGPLVPLILFSVSSSLL